MDSSSLIARAAVDTVVGPRPDDERWQPLVPAIDRGNVRRRSAVRRALQQRLVGEPAATVPWAIDDGPRRPPKPSGWWRWLR